MLERLRLNPLRLPLGVRHVALVLLAWLCPPVSSLLKGRLLSTAAAATLQLASSAALVWTLTSSSLSPAFLLLSWAVSQTLLAVAFWVGIDFGERSIGGRLVFSLPLAAVVPVTLLIGFGPWTFLKVCGGHQLEGDAEESWAVVRGASLEALRPGELVAAPCLDGQGSEFVRIVALPGSSFWLRSGKVCDNAGCLPQRQFRSRDVSGNEYTSEVEVLGSRFYFISKGSQTTSQDGLSSPPVHVEPGQFGVVPDNREAGATRCIPGFVVSQEVVVGGAFWGADGFAFPHLLQ